MGSLCTASTLFACCQRQEPRVINIACLDTREGRDHNLFGHFSTIYGTFLAPRAIFPTGNGTIGTRIKVSASSGEHELTQGWQRPNAFLFFHSCTGSGTNNSLMVIAANYHYSVVLCIPRSVHI